MKTFAAVMTMVVASALCGAMDVDAAGNSTTKPIRNLSAEPCDPKKDKNCSHPPPTKSKDSAGGNSAPGSKLGQPSEVETTSAASKGVERSVAGPPTNRSVSGTIGPRPVNPETKGANVQRAGDPVGGIDASLEKKVGSSARVKAP